LHREIGLRPLGVLFAVVLALHTFSPSTQVTDSRLSVYTAYVAIHDRTLDLDQLPPEAQANFERDDYDVVHRDGRMLPYFPYGPMLLLVPFVAAAELVGVDPPSLDLIGPNETWKIEQPAAALVVAATAVLIALLAYELAQGEVRSRRRTALWVAAFFAFGTAAWSTASRAFWQHTPAMLLLSAALLCIVRAPRSARSLALAGACLAGAYVMRPASAAVVVALAAWVVVCHRDRVVGFLLGAVAVAVPFVAINVWQYGAVLPPYYDPLRVGGEAAIPFAESLAVHLVSPSRGILVYLPLVCLLPWGLRAAAREGSRRSLLILLAAALAVHALVVARYGSTGGAAYGARFFTEVTPLLIVLLVPLFDALVRGELRGWLRTAFVGLAAISIVFAGSGATLRSGFCWSATPVPLDEDPSRVWDFGDPQFFRPVRDLRDGRSIGAIVAGSCTDP
jgi:hypothetical protein